MQKLQFNHIIFLFTLLIHQTAIYTMHNNKRLNTTKNFPQQNKNHTGGKIIQEPRCQNLGDRLIHRFLTELPKPIEKIKPSPEPSAPTSDANILLHNYNYPIYHDFDLEWTKK